MFVPYSQSSVKPVDFRNICLFHAFWGLGKFEGPEIRRRAAKIANEKVWLDSPSSFSAESSCLLSQNHLSYQARVLQ